MPAPPCGRGFRRGCRGGGRIATPSEDQADEALLHERMRGRGRPRECLLAAVHAQITVAVARAEFDPVALAETALAHVFQQRTAVETEQEQLALRDPYRNVIAQCVETDRPRARCQGAIDVRIVRRARREARARDRLRQATDAECDRDVVRGRLLRIGRAHLHEMPREPRRQRRMREQRQRFVRREHVVLAIALLHAHAIRIDPDIGERAVHGRMDIHVTVPFRAVATQQHVNAQRHAPAVAVDARTLKQHVAEHVLRAARRIAREDDRVRIGIDARVNVGRIERDAIAVGGGRVRERATALRSEVVDPAPRVIDRRGMGAGTGGKQGDAGNTGGERRHGRGRNEGRVRRVVAARDARHRFNDGDRTTRRDRAGPKRARRDRNRARAHRAYRRRTPRS
ncbi:hypothetical protein GPU89_20365 [Burkholderia cepacia]|nr:hypothetical protein [Burkholderia cepacia]